MLFYSCERYYVLEIKWVIYCSLLVCGCNVFMCKHLVNYSLRVFSHTLLYVSTSVFLSRGHAGPMFSTPVCFYHYIFKSCKTFFCYFCNEQMLVFFVGLIQCLLYVRWFPCAQCTSFCPSSSPDRRKWGH